MSGMGIIGTVMAGALEGAGRSAQPLADYTSRAALEAQAAETQRQRDTTLNEFARQRMVEQEGIRQRGRQADIDQDVDPANVKKKADAQSRIILGTMGAEVEKKKLLGAVDTQLKVDEFTKLEPLKRQAAVDDAVAVLRAQATPEMLRASRAIAQAKHIVDPSYTLIPNADGTVTAFDTKSGKASGALTGPDGKPIIRKSPEELNAAVSVINMATSNLRIAQAEHKATLADVTADPASKAASEAAWKNAQADAKRLTAPAYAVLYGKAGIDATPAKAVKIVDPFAAKAPSGEASAVAPTVPARKAPLGIVASQMQGDTMQSAFESEQREMESGRRREYSQPVKEWLDSQSKARDRGGEEFRQRELDRAQAESRARVGAR